MNVRINFGTLVFGIMTAILGFLCGYIRCGVDITNFSREYVKSNRHRDYRRYSKYHYDE